MEPSTSFCDLCGYAVPIAGSACPHCRGTASDPSLARPRRGPLTGILLGLEAIPRGLGLLWTTPGTKAWLLPPLVLTTLVLVVALWFSVGFVDGLLEQVLPEGFVLDDWKGWFEDARWHWIEGAGIWLVGALEWLLNFGWGWLLSMRWLLWFLVSSLVVWYCFSIAYEAFAGPFLDEIQGRIEARWFGLDPRSRLERPNDIPVATCARLAALTLALLVGLTWAFSGSLGWLAVVPAIPLAILPAAVVDKRFLPWARWVASVELRATSASLQATVITTLLIVLALPLYFVPVVGYFLFAAVTGFATAVGLLDIPFERRGWPLRRRMRFVTRNLLPFLAFGVSAGLLLAIPVFGPVLMVPSASIGGVWLICRLKKDGLGGARES